MALLHVSLPLAHACGGEDILYIIFLIFPGHLEFWTPLQIPVWGPPLACTLLQSSQGQENLNGLTPALSPIRSLSLPLSGQKSLFSD